MSDQVRVRRFERGASATGLDDFLKARGYSVSGHGMALRVWMPGKRKPVNFSRTQLIDLLDAERIKMGLEPVRSRNVPKRGGKHARKA